MTTSIRGSIFFKNRSFLGRTRLEPVGDTGQLAAQGRIGQRLQHGGRVVFTNAQARQHAATLEERGLIVVRQKSCPGIGGDVAELPLIALDGGQAEWAAFGINRWRRNVWR